MTNAWGQITIKAAHRRNTALPSFLAMTDVTFEVSKEMKVAGMWRAAWGQLLHRDLPSSVLLRCNGERLEGPGSSKGRLGCLSLCAQWGPSLKCRTHLVCEQPAPNLAGRQTASQEATVPLPPDWNGKCLPPVTVAAMPVDSSGYRENS